MTAGEVLQVLEWSQAGWSTWQHALLGIAGLFGAVLGGVIVLSIISAWLKDRGY